jgi:putative methionine-R-sulfoxide reductase with GAF domain
VKDLEPRQRKAAEALRTHAEAVAEAWARVAAESSGEEAAGPAAFRDELEAVIEGLAEGTWEGLLAADARRALALVQEGTSLAALAARIAGLTRACAEALPAGPAQADGAVAVGDVVRRRLETLVRAQEEETSRRLVEAQDEVAAEREKGRELAQGFEALRRAEGQHRRRADQIALLGSVAHRLAAIREPDRLLQEAAEVIRASMNYAYAAVVVLDHEGMLVGRWAGREGIQRRSAGRTQGPAGGVIGRALRRKAPQLVRDVGADPDYHPDVPGTRSELAVPLLEEGEAVGAVDVQSDEKDAFGLDDVAVMETLARFLVVTLHNARLFDELRRSRH